MLKYAAAVSKRIYEFDRCAIIYFDSDHVHDQKTRRSITGMIAYIGSTPPVTWASKHEGAIATRT
jgi:hypothetical protein